MMIKLKKISTIQSKVTDNIDLFHYNKVLQYHEFINNAQKFINNKTASKEKQ